MISNLFALEDQIKKINEHQPPLNKLNEVIDWEIFRDLIESKLKKSAKGPGGRPPYDKILMFKIIVLQKYYNLSDEQTEFQIKDRLSFMQFLGLNIGDNVPDATTIWLFKEELTKAGIIEKLFEEFNNRLQSKGIIAKTGSIVDASFVDVPKQRNTKEENSDIKKGATPLSFAKRNSKNRRDKLSQKDIDAKWTKKNNEIHFGFKDHIKVDKDTKFIIKFRVTDASVHDSQVIDELIDESDNELYADSAYRSEDIEKLLKEKNCKSQIHKKGYRNKPLSSKQKESNKAKSKIRARVEHIFGFMTNSMKGLTNRCIGLQRNSFQIGLMNLVYNLCRYEQLVRIYNIERIK